MIIFDNLKIEGRFLFYWRWLKYDKFLEVYEDLEIYVTGMW